MTGIDDDPDAPTLWAGRLRPSPDAAADAARPEAADPVEEATVVAARRRAAHAAPGPAPGVEADDGIDEGSTRVARRETRRRASRAPEEDTVARVRSAGAAPAPAQVENGRRTARVPDGQAREIYRPRTAQPAIVPRRAPAPRAPQHPPAPAPVRRDQRRALWVGLGVALAVIAGAAIIVALLAVG